MSSVSSVGETSASQYTQRAATTAPPSRSAVDPDNDGDTYAGVSKAQEAQEKPSATTIRTASGGINVQA